jgi:hypothetical protein
VAFFDFFEGRKARVSYSKKAESHIQRFYLFENEFATVRALGFLRRAWKNFKKVLNLLL